jgi:dienelactone hydrolase
MSTHRLLLIPALALALLPRPARADDDKKTCTVPDNGNAVEFWATDHPTAADENRCTTIIDPHPCHLSGYLYTPDGGGSNLPAIIYVHGSGETRDQKSQRELIHYFVSRGYVVFAPTMRGVGDTTCDSQPSYFTPPDQHGFHNTGSYIKGWVEEHNQTGTLEERELLDILYLHEEVSDLQLALDYLVARPGTGGTGKLVDPSRIAMMGHSYGGVIVTFGGAMSLTPRPAAAIAVSAGALQWESSSQWAMWLGAFSMSHQMPLYVLQTMDESPSHSTDSTLYPFMMADNNPGGGGAQMAAFSRFADDPDCRTPKDYTVAHRAHICFASLHSQVLRWARTVEDFLIRYGVD